MLSYLVVSAVQVTLPMRYPGEMLPDDCIEQLQRARRSGAAQSRPAVCVVPVLLQLQVMTEGDASIVAFHEPLNAIGLALRVQLALLKALWLPELLTHPDC